MTDRRHLARPTGAALLIVSVIMTSVATARPALQRLTPELVSECCCERRSPPDSVTHAPCSTVRHAPEKAVQGERQDLPSPIQVPAVAATPACTLPGPTCPFASVSAPTREPRTGPPIYLVKSTFLI